MSLHTKKSDSVTTPTYSFNDDTDTGVHSSGADALAMVCNGANVLAATTSGVAITGTLSTTAGTVIGASANAAKASTKLVVTKAAIADNTATAVATISIPNANNAAAFRVMVMSSLTGADAYESTRVAEYFVVVTRTAGVAAVAAIALSTVAATTIATISGGATLTTALTLGTVTGGATVTETVDIKATNVGSVGQVSETTLVIEEINALASGITVAAA